MLDWLKRNKATLYSMILVVVGALGGNVDRIDKVVKAILYVLTPTTTQVDR